MICQIIKNKALGNGGQILLEVLILLIEMSWIIKDIEEKKSGS